MKKILRRPGVQRAIARTLAAYLRFAYRTTRWTLEGETQLAAHALGPPVICAVWHERLAVMPALMRFTGPPGGPKLLATQALASRHRDGQLLGAVLQKFGFGLVSGSTSRGGAAALRTLIAAIRRGEHIFITPDGPRGPRRQAAPGVAQLAAIAGVPVLPCGAQTSRAHVLHKSWDRMVIPRPFGRGALVVGEPIVVPREGWEAMVPVIGAALDRAAARADELADELAGR